MRANRRLYIFLFAFPAVLFALAKWDSGRVTELPALDRSPFYPAVATRAKDENSAAKDPTAANRAAPVVVRSTSAHAVENREPDLDAVPRFVRHWAHNIAILGAVAALVALLIGGGGLLLLHRAARIALRSRDDLAREFERAHRLLPYLLGGATLSLSSAVSCVLGFEALKFWIGGAHNVISVQLMIVFGVSAIGAAALTVRALRALPAAFAITAPEPTSLLGQELTRAGAPSLWTWIEHLASRTRTAPPDRIVVGLIDEFAVTSHPVLLKPSAATVSGTLLYLPLAMLALLDEGETAAIVGHELGHFSGADLDYSLRFKPIYDGISRSLDAATSFGRQRDGTLALATIPAWILGSWFQSQFLEAVAHWSRVREFEADQFSARVAGRRASVTALVRSIACDKPIREVYGRVTRSPESAPSDLVREIRTLAAHAGVDDPTAHLEVTLTHPTDTHPPTSERILALGESVPLSDEIAVIAGRAVNENVEPWCAPLFRDFELLSRELTREFVSDVAEREAAFDEVLGRVADISCEPRDFFERTWPAMSLYVALALGCAAFALTLFTAENIARASLFGAGALLLATFFGFRAFHHWRRGRTPFMRIAGDGFTLYGATDTIRWADVLDIAHSQFKNTVSFNFLLQENVPIALHGTHFRRVTYRAEPGLLSICVRGVRKTGPDRFIELVYQYSDAAKSRAFLDERIAARRDDHATE